MFTGEEDKDLPATAGAEAMAPRVVLFDFDGVLFQGDSFRVFITERYARSPLRKLLAVANLPWLLPMWPISWRVVVRTLVNIGLLGVGERRYAAEAGVPVVANPPVARALYRVNVGDPIPETMFEVVAAILRWVNSVGALREPSPTLPGA